MLLFAEPLLPCAWMPSMLFAPARTRNQSLRLATTLLVSLLPLLLGAPLMYWQAGRLLQQRAENAAIDTRIQLDELLASARQVADEAIALAGQPCADVVPMLRRQAMTSPYLRSVNLVSDGQLYCASLTGPLHEADTPERYVEHRLRLLPGNGITPDRALLVFRLQQDDKAVLIGIDGLPIRKILQLIGQSVHLQLTVGDAHMGRDGEVSQAPAWHPQVAPVSVQVADAPLLIRAGFDEGEQWRFIRAQYTPLLILLVFLGVLAGVTGHALDQRASSPRRELARALSAGELVPYYQPLVDSRDNVWSGVEVLMRWQHPNEGMVPPSQFIPLAEESGLIVPMTTDLLRRVRHDLAANAERLPVDFHVSVNITAAHCQDLSLVSECRDFIDAFEPGRIHLTLELTERQMIESSETTRRLFAALRQIGVRLAIDDFGTGHSSLGYLREFQVNYLKIDQSFVAMIGSDALSRHLLENIVDLSTRLELNIVAEGVETLEQRDYLRDRGVHYLQGYLFARPMPLEMLLETLALKVPGA